MGLKRRFKLMFTEETITDEGCVIKEKPPIMGQIVESEEMFQQMLIPDIVISKTLLQKLYVGLNAELDNPNHYLKNKIEKDKIIEESEIQTIIPLHPTK